MNTFHFSLIATLLLAVAIPVTQCQAACWCSWDYCVGLTDPLIIDDSKTKITTNEYDKTTSSQSNGSCTIPGTTAPKKKCSVNGATTTTFSWEVAGSLSFQYFGVSATHGSLVTQTLGNSCEAEITSWCSCCFQRAYEKYEFTYKEGWCYCDIGALFCTYPGTKYTGSKSVFQGLHCDDKPECVVPPNCSANCPSGG